MILVIDNYDSFVYSLARYVAMCGTTHHVVRNDEITLKEIKLLKPHKIILSPGPCAPDKAGICLDLVKNFYDSIPILGVCLGHQVIGQVFGAKIERAKFPLHGMTSGINHTQAGIFKNIKNPLTVGRYHSLIVNGIDKNSELEVTATSFEGEVMALEHKTYPIYGVQFHPESIMTECGLELIKNFISI